jgi:hypothetical protein
LTRCASLLPEFGPWVASVKRRVIDLLRPFGSFHYYQPEQRGSASIKAVMPALTGRGYDELEIHEGSMASQEYLRVTFTGVADEERQRVRANWSSIAVATPKAWSGLLRRCGRQPCE